MAKARCCIVRHKDAVSSMQKLRSCNTAANLTGHLTSICLSPLSLIASQHLWGEDQSSSFATVTQDYFNDSASCSLTARGQSMSCSKDSVTNGSHSVHTSSRPSRPRLRENRGNPFGSGTAHEDLAGSSTSSYDEAGRRQRNSASSQAALSCSSTESVNHTGANSSRSKTSASSSKQRLGTTVHYAVEKSKNREVTASDGWTNQSLRYPSTERGQHLCPHNTIQESVAHRSDPQSSDPITISPNTRSRNYLDRPLSSPVVPRLVRVSPNASPILSRHGQNSTGDAHSQNSTRERHSQNSTGEAHSPNLQHQNLTATSTTSLNATTSS